MQDFIFNVTTKILFGKDQMENLGKEIKKYGKKILLVYGGGSIKKNGIYDKVVSALKKEGIDFVELSGVEPNPRLASAVEGIRLVKDNKLDFILAVGGGSVVDCSKLIAAGAVTEADPWDIVLMKEEVKGAIPLGSVLTISATGTDMDTASVITNPDTKQKLGWASPYVLPKFSLLNPEFTFTVSAYQTAAGTADIMSHTMENYFTTYDDCFLQDSMAESILKTCVKYGPLAIKEPENYEARANLMWANTWAINGILDSGKRTAWSVHAMEHELSAFYDITHGVGLAILTPKWLDHILSVETAPKIARFARNVFSIEEKDDLLAAKAGIKALEDFFSKIGIPHSLKEVGIGEDKLDLMAKACIKNKKGNIKGFVELSEEDVLAIYKLSL